MISNAKTIHIKDIKPLVEVTNSLAVNLHRMLAEEKQNVFFSPFSVSAAMAMLLCAAEGETASEMCSALGYDDAGIIKEDIASIFEQQISLLQETSESYTLSTSNLMLNRNNFPIKEKYKETLLKSFKALTWEIDVRKETKTLQMINEYIRKETNNMIKKAVQSLSLNTAIMFINCIYFKGTWMEKFDKERTHPETFYNKGTKNNATEVDMMEVDDMFSFCEDNTLKALQLPYIGAEVAMLILLPHERDGLESVDMNLSPSFVQDFKKKLRRTDVRISLPRFRLEYEKSLVQCFRKLGIQRAFFPGANLKNASDSSELQVGAILHKAVLEVNEEGSEAAASTSVCVADGPGPKRSLFFVDHPFAFIIYNTRSDLILFMGRVSEL